MHSEQKTEQKMLFKKVLNIKYLKYFLNKNEL